MKLSIGMIVKNEEKYLDRCLTALRPILENIDSELIIVDTGSTDKTVEIAKSHTKKVYYYKWIDDFAAARNETIKYATGEWYMFVDADEILQDATEIIKFFKSNEYKKYDCAKYYISNCAENNSKLNLRSQLYRMFKLTSDTKFIGIIHEVIKPFGIPKAMLNTVFDHFGYYLSKKELADKLKRNRPLMLKRLENGIDHPMHRKQLADSYTAESDYDSAYFHLQEGLNLLKANYDLHVSTVLHAELIYLYLKQGNHEAVISTATKFLDTKKQESVTDLDIYYCMLSSNIKLKNYDECISAYENYIRLAHKYIARDFHSPEEELRTIFFANEEKLALATKMAIDAYILTNNFDKAVLLLEDTSIVNYNELQNPEDFMYRYFEIMKNTNNFSNLEQLYKHISSFGNSLQSKFESTLEIFIKSNVDIEPSIISQTASFEYNTQYVSYLQLKYYCLKNHCDFTEKMIEFISTSNDLDEKYSRLLEYILEYNIPASVLHKKMNFGIFNMLIESIAKFDIELIKNYNPADITIQDYFYLKNLYEVALKHISSDSYEVCIEISEKYLAAFEQYIKTTLNISNINDECINIFPLDVQFGYHYKKAFEYKKLNNQQMYIRQLTLALRSNENYKDLISILLENMEKERKEVDEFAKLSNSIKSNIYTLIQSADFVTAKNILNQYKSINPSDPEIQELENKIIQ